MLQILGHWLISTVAVLISAYILPGVKVEGIFVAFVFAVILGVINTVLKPILIVLTFPLTVLTLGLFVFVINALLIWLTSFIVPGFAIDSFWWALAFGLILSLVNAILQKAAGQ